jgi:hypothetical protein
MHPENSIENVCAERTGHRSKPGGTLLPIILMLSPILLYGCGSDRYQEMSAASAPSESFRYDAPAPKASVARDQDRSMGMMGGMGGMMSGMMMGGAMPAKGGPNLGENIVQEIPGGAVAKAAGANRKIIYTATVDLVTDNLNTLEPKLIALVSEAGGFVAETNQTGSAGGQRSATWKIRVPVDNYDGFLQKTRQLGEVRSVHVNSQDVTEEFVDVTARVSAKKVQEQRLIDLIKNATGNLEEVLKVEGELARVRSEIERMEGRLRVLKDQTELTTVTVSVSEIKDYVPPEAPTFATKIHRAWTDSTDLLQRNLGNLVLGLVAWAPFLPFYVVGWGFALWLLWRGWRKIRPVLLADLHRTIRPNTIGEIPKRENDTPETS